jgi:hypothetical protein
MDRGGRLSGFLISLWIAQRMVGGELLPLRCG